MIAAGALFAALAVGLGAFGAHGLKAVASEKTLDTFETAVRYQFYHAVALILTGLLAHWQSSKLLKWAGIFFIAGIILFCCSLYLLVVFQTKGNETMNWLGAVTPFGGVAFISGWLLLAAAFMRSR